MPAKETKHDKFLRLMQARLLRTLEEFRMLGSLACRNYEHSPEEAQEVINHLDGALHELANKYAVPFTSAVGKPKLRAGRIDETDIAKALDKLKANDPEAAQTILKTALAQKPR